MHNLNRRNQRSIRFFSPSYILISARIELQAWELKSFSRRSRKTRRSQTCGRRIVSMTKKHRSFVVLLSLSILLTQDWQKDYREKKHLRFIQLAVREKKKDNKKLAQIGSNPITWRKKTEGERNESRGKTVKKCEHVRASARHSRDWR